MSIDDYQGNSASASTSAQHSNHPNAANIKKLSNEVKFVFECSDKLFALPSYVIDEVIEYKKLDRWHDKTSRCAGTIIHRDKVLAIFNPYKLCFGDSEAGESRNYIVIASDGQNSFGLLISKYLGLHSLSENSDITRFDFDEQFPSTTMSQQYLIGMVNFNGKTLALLQGSRLFELAKIFLGMPDNPALVSSQFGESLDAGVYEEFIAAKIGATIIAAPIRNVTEIVEGLEVMPVFGVDPCIRGLTNLRGKIIACIDLSNSMNLPQRALDDRSVFMLLASNNTDFALCVDAVVGSRSLPTQQFAACEKIFPEHVMPIFTGIIQHERQTYLRLSVEGVTTWSVLSPLRINDEK